MPVLSPATRRHPRPRIAPALVPAALLFAAAHAQSVIPASQADITFFRPFEGNFVGSIISGQVALLGDLDDDGYGEFLLSTAATIGPTNLAGPGRTYVVSGLTHQPIYTFNGEDLHAGGSTDQLGVSADNAGDVDGDGVNDIVIGSHSPVSSRRGLVFSGRTGGLLLTCTPSFSGPFGSSVTGVGDLDRDGHADVAVADAVRTIVFSGSGVGVFAAAVSSPAPAGDVNADGFGDFIGVSISGVVVISGADGTGIRFIFGAPGVSGRKCTGVGDLNGDGYDDFAGCWPEEVRVYSGIDDDITLLTLRDDRTDQNRSVRAAGDVNGDGVNDILVASPVSPTQIGEVRVYSGRTGALMRTYTEPTQSENFAFAFGGAIAGEHDVNGDGLADVIIRSFRGGGVAGEDGPVAYVFFSPPPCPADITFDRTIDMLDLDLLLSEFGVQNAFPHPRADITGDGRVSFADLNLVLAAYGSACR